MAESNNAKFHVQNNSDIEGNSLTAAQNCYEKGSFKEALNLFLNVASKNPDSNVYVDIGSCYYMLENYREAKEYWSKAINLNAKNSKAYANLGNLNYKDGNIEKAISLWISALVSKPEDANTCRNLAVAFGKKEMKRASIKYFEKYLKYEENKSSDDYIQVKNKIEECLKGANRFLHTGEQLQMAKDDKQAMAYYLKSVALYPNIAKTNINLGNLFFAKKDFASAVKYWASASYIDKNFYQIYSNLAFAYEMLQKFDYAYCYYCRYINYISNNKNEYYTTDKKILKLKPFINTHPELVSKHLELAQKHLANNEFEEAIDEFKNYSTLKPEEKDTYKKVIEKLENCLEPELGIISYCLETGNKLFDEKCYSEAKYYFQRIMKLSAAKYVEFSMAKTKFAQCERALREADV